MNTISLGIITIFLVLRTYALYYRRFWVLAVTVPLGITNVVLAALCLTKVKTTPLSISTGALHSCFSALVLSETPFKTSWTITIVFDTLISVLTISKTYRMHCESRKVGIESRLADMILQDGSLYYSVMTAVNMINFALFWTEDFDFIEASAGNSSEIAHSISVIIVSRMMLNIMEAADSQGGDYSEDSDNRSAESQCNLSSVRFATQHSAVTTGPRGPMQWPSESVHESARGKGTERATLETADEVTMGTRMLEMTIDSSEDSNHSMHDPFTQF